MASTSSPPSPRAPDSRRPGHLPDWGSPSETPRTSAVATPVLVFCGPGDAVAETRAVPKAVRAYASCSAEVTGSVQGVALVTRSAGSREVSRPRQRTWCSGKLAYPVEHPGQETRLWTGPGAEAPSRYASVPAPDYGLRPFSAGRFSRRSSSTKCRCAPDVAFVFSVEVEVACIGRKGAQGVRVTPAGGRPGRVPSPDARLRPRVSRRRGRRVGSRPRTHRGTVRRSVPPRRCSDRVACRSS